jgi:hypothetical protein
MEETKKETKYINSKIYTIRSFKTDMFYIGSTYDKLHKRLSKHRSAFKNYSVSNFYMTSFEIVKFDDNFIELLEEYPCESKMQLLKREGEMIRLHKLNAVNICVPGRTKKEWEEDNIERNLEVRKIYNENNKEFIAKNKKEYAIEHREEIIEYKKQYRLDNIDAIKVKNKIYRDKNKDEINIRARTKVICTCGEEISIGSLSKHKSSGRHDTIMLNKDKIRHKPLDIINCDCGLSFQYRSKTRHEKRQAHMDYIKSKD